MKRITWRKHHKWFGLIFAFFIILFGASGIVLNHRQLFSDYQISRKWLPDATGTRAGTTECCGELSPVLPVSVKKTALSYCLAMPAFF